MKLTTCFRFISTGITSLMAYQLAASSGMWLPRVDKESKTKNTKKGVQNDRIWKVEHQDLERSFSGCLHIVSLALLCYLGSLAMILTVIAGWTRILNC